jgi:hypothetical protein
MCPPTAELPGRRGIRVQPGRWWRLCAPPTTCPGTGSWARAERSNCGATRRSSKDCDSRPRGLRSEGGASTCACTSISSEEQGALRRAKQSGSERVAGGQRGDQMQCCVAELRSAGQTRRPPPRVLCWLTPCTRTMRTGLAHRSVRATRAFDRCRSQVSVQRADANLGHRRTQVWRENSKISAKSVRRGTTIRDRNHFSAGIGHLKLRANSNSGEGCSGERPAT